MPKQERDEERSQSRAEKKRAGERRVEKTAAAFRGSGKENEGRKGRG